MGMILDGPKPIWAEVRGESFYLGDVLTEELAELMISDIPKIRATLDIVENYVKERDG